MLRKILTVIGLIEALAPRRFINTFEGLALENPDECRMKSWVVPVARVEGLFFLFLIWRGDSSYSAFKRFLGIIGLPALLSPRLYIDFAAGIAYTGSENCKWKPWSYIITRVFGFLYVLIAIDELRNR